MDGFFSTPFLRKYPSSLKASFLNSRGLYADLNKSISKGHLQIGVHKGAFLSLIDEIEVEEPDLAKKLISLEAAGKIKPEEIVNKIPSSLKPLAVRKSILKKISGAYLLDTDTLFHDTMEQEDWKGLITIEGKKPVFLDEDLSSGAIEFLFRERSLYLNIGDEFNWSRFIHPYVLPFKKIRILDPYLYVHILQTGLSGLLKTLIKKSKHGRVRIEIISDLTKNDRRKDEVLKIVKDELEEVNQCTVDLALFDQKGDVSNLFHKRLVWTDFWTLYTDRGFDFLKLEPGRGMVKRENTLFLSGKYASDESVWHQVESNWDVYLSKSKKVLEL